MPALPGTDRVRLNLSRHKPSAHNRGFPASALTTSVSLTTSVESTSVSPLIYPTVRNKTLRPAPLLNSRPDFRALAAKGGANSWLKRGPEYHARQSFNATLQAMRRWGHDSPLLSMPALERDRLMRAIWEQGFKAGAGYKRS